MTKNHPTISSHSRLASNIRSVGCTHTGELDAAVSALDGSSALLDVKVTELSTGGLDDADLVGTGVVPVEAGQSELD